MVENCHKGSDAPDWEAGYVLLVGLKHHVDKVFGNMMFSSAESQNSSSSEAGKVATMLCRGCTSSEHIAGSGGVSMNKNKKIFKSGALVLNRPPLCHVTGHPLRVTSLKTTNKDG